MTTYTQQQLDAAVAKIFSEAAIEATIAERARASTILEAGQSSALALKLVELGMSAEDALDILAAAPAEQHTAPARTNTTADEAVAMFTGHRGNSEQRDDVSTPVAMARAFNAARIGVSVDG